MGGLVVRRLGGAAAGGALLALAASALGPVALAAGQTVDIVGFSFSPPAVTVSVGDTVTWANADAQGHTATADGGAFDTGTIGDNSSKAVTLTSAGTFAYHCRIHPAMTATLVVTGAGAPPATDTDDFGADMSAGGGAADTALPGFLLALAGAGGLGLGLGLHRFRVRRRIEA